MYRATNFIFYISAYEQFTYSYSYFSSRRTDKEALFSLLRRLSTTADLLLMVE